MAFISKRILVSIITGIALIVGYIIYALGSNAPATGDLKAWATLLLIFIAISVVAQIVIMILFYIVSSIGISIKEGDESGNSAKRIIESESVEDERDKMNVLKSARFGYILGGVGAVGMLLMLAFGDSSIAALHILFAGFAVGSMVEGFARIYYNEKGV